MNMYLIDQKKQMVGSDHADKIIEQPQARCTALLRVELDTEDVPVAD